MEKVLVVEAENSAQITVPAQNGRAALPSPPSSGGNPARHASGERPDPQSVRGRCPECGDDLVSNLYYIPGEGYLIKWQCWSSLAEGETACRYSKVL